MTSPSVADAAVGLGARIGRYFSIVSMVPSLFLVVWTTVLVASDAWRSEPNLSLMVDRLGDLGLPSIAWLLLITTVVALFLHPLQLAMTRLLEGYWGSSPIAVRLLSMRIAHYRRRWRNLHARERELSTILKKRLKVLLVEQYFNDLLDRRTNLVHPENLEASQRKKDEEYMLASNRAHDLSGLQAALESIRYEKSRYPAIDRMMPTRLGNALRQAEDTIGKQYGLNAIRTAPHLTLVLPELDRNYLNDTRQQLDTSVKLCVVALLITIETIVCLFTDGWWLLVALGPYFLTYTAYRSAVAAADAYMAVFRTVLDLNRFKLYESLHVRLPMSTAYERRTNAKLMELLKGNEKVSVRYKHPATGTPTDTSSSTPPGTS
ncbi:hypothetical protein [Amycolatopsis sp. cmx-8-4]|uniref:hypothetical protein n=1 Tax=Amycolatopsis sp. cmx-8-4 TaxID=2790947 RepID=UPI00397A52DA